MTRLTPSERAEMSERLDAATDGPWTVDRPNGNFRRRQREIRHHGENGYGPCSTLVATSAAGHHEDAAFIAHAREDIPRLLADSEACEGLAQAVDAVLDGAGRDGSGSVSYPPELAKDSDWQAVRTSLLAALRAARSLAKGGG